MALRLVLDRPGQPEVAADVTDACASLDDDVAFARLAGHRCGSVRERHREERHVKYVCPQCGVVSKEGLAVGEGPWCGKCGSEMKMVLRATTAKKKSARRPKDTPTELQTV
jgi:predicted RNA-binding Zn-ribbon protein involved in translation (DUF1610 family)